MPDNLDKLVYLDLEFVSRKFEEVFGVDPAMKVTRQEGASAGIKALFANAGVTTQESRTYSVTSREMLQRLWAHLNGNYEAFTAFENYEGTKVLWVTGNLTVGEWKQRGSEAPGYEYFEL